MIVVFVFGCLTFHCVRYVILENVHHEKQNTTECVCLGAPEPLYKDAPKTVNTNRFRDIPLRALVDYMLSGSSVFYEF